MSIPTKNLPLPVAARVLLACLALSALGGNLPSQRGVRTLPSTGASDVQLSPNGAWVAYKTDVNGTKALGILSVVPNSQQTILVADKNFTHFLWAPDSAGLYYQVGSTIHWVRSIGGTPKQITQISGVNPRMYALDGKDTFLVGSRSNSAGGSAIFTVPTDGSTLAKDIRTSNNDVFGEIALDPAGTRITYTSQVSQSPFAPIDIRAIDVDGKNDGSLSGPLPRTGVAVRFPTDLAWADNGNTVMFSAGRGITAELMRVTLTASTPLSLTGPPQHFRALSISGDTKTTVFLGTTKHGHLVPGIMPTTGGARIPLEPEKNWVVSGRPSIDAGGTAVAFAGYEVGTIGGRPEVQLIQLDREITVEPRPALGAQLTFRLPLLFGERGTLYAATDLLPADPKQQIQIPGLAYAVAVDPTVLIPLISGTGSGQPLSFSATVPNDVALIGYTVYLQGMRVRSGTPLRGDFTRYAELQFLQ